MRRAVLVGFAALSIGVGGSRGVAQVLPRYSEPVEGPPALRAEEQPAAGPTQKSGTKPAVGTPPTPAPGNSPPAASAPGSSPPAAPVPGKDSPAASAPGNSSPAASAPGSSPPAAPVPGKDSPVAPGTGKDSPAAPATPASLPLDTREGHITAVFSPKNPVLGKQSEVSVTFTVLDRNGTPVPSAELQLTSSVGHFAELQSLEDGRFTAAFLPPQTRFPQVALCSVLDRRHPALGALFAIPLTGTIKLPIQSRPGLSLEFDVAGRIFGPFASDEAGKVQADLEVPPGVNRVRVTAHPKAGAKDKEGAGVQWLSLPAPEFVRVKLLALPPLTADGETGTLVQALVVDTSGQPMLGAQVEMSAALGVIAPPTEVGDGVYRARYTPPRLTVGRTDTLIVRLPDAGPVQEERLTVSLLAVAPPPPPPKTLSVPPGEQWVAPPERPLQPIAEPSGSGSR